MPDDPFYRDRTWWKLRSQAKAQWVRDGKGCGMCQGEIGKGSIVDHIKPRKDHPHLEYDINNLQLLCTRCHNIKTHKHERLNLPSIGLDGMPEGGSWG